MKVYLAVLFAFTTLQVSCYYGKETAKDENLNVNADHWKAKTNSKLAGLGTTSFGPYKQSSFQQLNKTKRKGEWFPLPKIFGRAECITTTHIYQVKMHSENDLAFVSFHNVVNVKMWNYGLFSKQEYETRSLRNLASGTIILDDDSSCWEFEIGPYSPKIPYPEDFVLNTHGFIKNGDKNLRVEYIAEFNDSTLEDYKFKTNGVVIRNNDGDMIAALQLRGDPYVWIHKELSASEKLALASVFTVVLGTRDQ